MKILIAVVVLCVCATSCAALHVMPWFCLERCNFTAKQIEKQLADIVDFNYMRPTIDIISYERYNLGPNSTLLLNADLYDFNQYMKKKVPHIKRIAMVSSWPYPEAFLSWMRQLFRNPYPFIEAAVRDMQKEGVDGLNIDFEPTVRATPEDAQNYADFLKLLREQLWMRARKVVSVDAAGWNSIWNLPAMSYALGQPITKYNNWTGRMEYIPKGTIATMNTYTYNNTIFLQQFKAMYNLFYDNHTRAPRADAAEWLAGLETWIDRPSFTEADLLLRLEALYDADICDIAIWDTPFDAKWWRFLQYLHDQCTSVPPDESYTESVDLEQRPGHFD